MKRILFALAFVVGCYQVGEPTPAVQFSLVTIDSQALPRSPIGWPADRAIQAAGLDFDADAELTDGAHGIVAFTTTIGGESSTTRHDFGVTGSILHINLCPIGALCTALVLSELVGPITGDGLVLTYSLGGGANSVFRFQALGAN